MSRFPDHHLYTGGDNSPFLPALLSAINHATHIDITTAFIRQTGLSLLTEALEDALERNVKLRVLTGDYLFITDPAALRSLMLLKEMGAEVRIFESKNTQSFHMKAYIFTKIECEEVSEGCAFVGSSNISKSALQTGLEWNLKVDYAENPIRYELIRSEFDSIFTNPNSKVLTHKWIDNYSSYRPENSSIPLVEPGANELDPPPVPNDIQAEALSALHQSRKLGFRRGLVVMATGLGKTWLAAFDTQDLNAKRVLFVAHRDEILSQAERTFVRIRPDAKTGKYTGKQQQLNVDMLFASIQTLGKLQHLRKFPIDYFDYIIVDEFHHAAAQTYQKLLAHFKPQFLLGLTATPERTDQAEILNLCDDNLVYRCDLFDGVNAKLLCPFKYYGIGDEHVNYQEIPWRNGKFEVNQLVNQLATQARAKHNFDQWKNKKLTRTLAFCVSKRHADFMADFFNKRGVKAVAVYSDSTVRRNEALDDLRNRRIDIIFSVDLFNEGVDVPAIDTVLMLRPTESKILFLQQLGRGLRLHDNKEKLVVIDFIGNHISFFRKVEVLFQTGINNADRRRFIEKVEANDLNLPTGCFVNYDIQAIDFMKSLTALRIDAQEEIYSTLKESYGRRPSLSEFYFAGGSIETIRREHGQWFQFIAIQGDLTSSDNQTFRENAKFFKELETTRLTKSFKMVLLEAMIDKEGFENGIDTKDLAEYSFDILHRRRKLLVDLPKHFLDLSTIDEQTRERFRKYWLDNPIKAWIGGNTSKERALFELSSNIFRYKENIKSDMCDSLSLLSLEIIGYRYLRYEERLESQPKEHETTTHLKLSDKGAFLPFFSDLKIACGHFTTSGHDTENIETRLLPLSYGRLDPAKHFIACAKGNSMNGGMNPIQDGDHLLLEVISPTSAGSISNQVIAIERQDTFGEDQYLLRYVKKIGPDNYELQAFNTEFENMIASDEMRTFARFKTVIDPADMMLHQTFSKQQAAESFGLEYIEGIWKMSGHVFPKDSNDQFLFVNLNKQGANPQHRYHDYFKSPDIFHWQTQNRASPDNKWGQSVINHLENHSHLHLFVRKHKRIKGKASLFYYCGKVLYKSHHGSGPMNIKFELECPLSPELFDYFK